MDLPYDVARCPGLLENGHPSPVRLCMSCARYWGQATGGPRTPYIQPPAGIREMGERVEIYCDSRMFFKA